MSSIAESVVHPAAGPMRTVWHPKYELVVPDVADTTASQKTGGAS